MMLTSIDDMMNAKAHETRCTRVKVLCGGHLMMLIQVCWSRKFCSDLTRKAYLNFGTSVTVSRHMKKPCSSSGVSHWSQTKCHVSLVWASRTVIWLRNLYGKKTYVILVQLHCVISPVLSCSICPLLLEGRAVSERTHYYFKDSFKWSF